MKLVISPTYMHLTLISCICYENVNIRGRKYLWYRFFVRANPSTRVCPIHFYGICNEQELASGCATGKISVLFMISVSNLQYSDIEGSGPKSWAENRIGGKRKNTIYCGL